MNVFACIPLTRSGEQPNQRHNRAHRLVNQLFDAGGVQIYGTRLARDFSSGSLGNYAKFGFGLRQRDSDIQPSLQPAQLVEHRTHIVGATLVFEKNRVNDL